jgi:hypothetical protein
MRPPVEDSETATVSPRSFRRAPIASASGINVCIVRSSLFDPLAA